MTIPSTSFMPATPDPVHHWRGDSFNYAFRIRSTNVDGSLGPPINLTGCSVKSQLRNDSLDAGVLLEFTAQIAPDQVVSTGVVLISCTAAQSAALVVQDDETTVDWDVQVTYPDGRVQTFLATQFVIHADTTR